MHVPVVGVVEVPVPDDAARPVLMHNDGHDRIASMLFWRRGLEGWEPNTIKTFLRLIPPGGVILDVGANSGLFALLAARRDRSARVHAVEPVTRVFEVLRANVALNRLDNVTCHRLACSDRSGMQTLQVPADEPVPVMASLLDGWCEGQAATESVECVTVDGLVATAGIERVDVIKIDAEGAEDAVLRGARSTLEEHRPFIVAEVLQRGGLGESVAAALDDSGYHQFRLGPRGPQALSDILGGTDDDENHNYLFAHGTRVEEMYRILG